MRRNRLFIMSEQQSVKVADEVCVLLSGLPSRFIRKGVRAGTVFIDTFADEHWSASRASPSPASTLRGL